MYDKKMGKEIILWCDGKREEVRKRKRDEQSGSSHYRDREEEVDEVFLELKEKHKDKIAPPRLRLWARMICSGIHDSTDTPPNIPAFTGRYKLADS